MMLNFSLQHNARTKTAELHLNGTIGDGWFGDVSAKDVTEAINGLPKSTLEIDVYLNSPGGIVFEGIAIFNALKNNKARVNMNVRGLAASSASVVAMAGDEINIEEGAMLMIHNASGLTFGPSSEHVKMAEDLDKIDGQLAGIYARRSKEAKADILEMMNEETWFTAEEAVAAGFADRALEAEGDEEVAAHWRPQILAAYSSTPERIAAMAKESDESARCQRYKTTACNLDELIDENQSSKPPEGGNNNAADEPQKEQETMTEQTAQNTPAETVAATLDELKLIAGNDSDFVLAQFEAKATADQALRAWDQKQIAQLKADKLKAETDLAAKEAENAKIEAELKAARDKPGVDPIEGDGSTASGGDAEWGDPIHDWNEKVQAKVAKGTPLFRAKSEVNRENPGLREAMVEAAN
jgi:ATP-dependent protease ClpP protease subunit